MFENEHDTTSEAESMQEDHLVPNNADGETQSKPNRKKKYLIITSIIVVAVIAVTVAVLIMNNPTKQVISLLEDAKYSEVVTLVTEKDVSVNEQVMSTYSNEVKKFSVENFEALARLSGEDWEKIGELNKIAIKLELDGKASDYVVGLKGLAQYQDFYPVISTVVEYNSALVGEDTQDLSQSVKTVGILVDLTSGKNDPYNIQLHESATETRDSIQALIDNPSYFTQSIAMQRLSDELAILQQYLEMYYNLELAIQNLPKI